MASADAAGQSTLSGTNGRLSAAQKLMQKHDEAHQPTLEDVPDEEDLTPHPHPLSTSVLESTDENAPAPGWAAPMSAKAAGKRKVESSVGTARAPLVDTQSDELFPSLGGPSKPSQAASAAPIWGVKKSTPATNGHGVATNGTSTPTSGLGTPPPVNPKPAARVGGPSVASQFTGPVYTFEPQELPRSATRKPLPDILRDINKKYRVNLAQTTGEGGIKKIGAAGPQIPESVRRQAFKALGDQFTTKTSTKVPIPRSARAHIIGKQGSTIKSLQEMSGARIQMPKLEDTPEPSDDDDDTIYVVVEGNPIAIRIAKEAVGKIASERTATVNTKLRSIPAELYPFIAGPYNSTANSLEEVHGVQIRVPPHHTWTSQPPPPVPPRGSAPAFIPAVGDNHITLAGDRVAVQAARAEVERLARELQQQLTLEQLPINRGRHQFIIGDRGVPAQEFFADTGCAIILPGEGEDDTITFVGPSNQIQQAMDKAMDLAMGMQSSSLDLTRQLRNVKAPQEHARNLTNYLRSRKEIERIERQHQAHIVTPLDPSGAISPWELYSRDGKNAIKAQSEIGRILEAHPPSRMATIPVDPFFHQHLQKDIMPRVKADFSVHVVIPNVSDGDAPVLLVFEGENGLEPDYQVPRGRPSAEEVKSFKEGLEAAQKHILDIINAQEDIISATIDVPAIFHEKLRKYIKKEQQNRTHDQIPIRVTANRTLVTLRGPAPAVKTLASKVEDFVEQAIEDEKERGFSLSFDFPQKHANQLIGKSGSNVHELRERFDVEIQVNDGKVEVKGPKAKAEAAKSHISALGRQWADEATYILKVEPKYHSELIGAKGSQIKKLENRYSNVQIHFPRSARPLKDDQSNADAASEAGRKGGRREQQPDEVIVKGPKKGADGARDEILSLLQYIKDTSHSATVSVQPSQIPSLIGQRGAEMDKVRQETGAKIDVPNARDSKDISARVDIQIKGTKSAVTQAKKMIEEKKEIFDRTVTRNVDVDKKYHRGLIGAKGATISDIVVKAGGSNASAQTVQFPKADADGNAIKVTGTVDVVDKIIATIEKMVAEWESQATEIIEVPTEKHRSLIGRGGDIKKDLETKFSVVLDIPRQGSGQTGVKITGLPKDVESAKAYILNLVKEQEGETIQVPRKVHHAVSDNGQFFRRLRNDLKVTVDVNKSEVPPKPAAVSTRSNGSSMPLITDDTEEAAGVHDFKTVDVSESGLDGEVPWVLRGSPESIAKARDSIAAAIEQALRYSTIGYLTLPDPHTYRYVIGQAGSKVNSIRKATGCKITVPRDQAKDEPIEIVGSADGVEKARELILKAVTEGSNANRS